MNAACSSGHSYSELQGISRSTAPTFYGQIPLV